MRRLQHLTIPIAIKPLQKRTYLNKLHAKATIYSIEKKNILRVSITFLPFTFGIPFFNVCSMWSDNFWNWGTMSKPGDWASLWGEGSARKKAPSRMEIRYVIGVDLLIEVFLWLFQHTETVKSAALKKDASVTRDIYYFLVKKRGM